MVSNTRTNQSAHLLSVDLHGDILLDVLHRRRMLAEDHVLLGHHLEPLKLGQVKVQVLPVYVESRYQPEGTLRQAILAIDALYQELSESGDAFQLVRSSQDLAATLQSDSIGVLLSFEGAEPLGRDVSLIDLFYKLGLRVLGLTWNRANLFAQGVLEDTDQGLSLLGRDLVSRANRIGVILDVSHLNRRSFWDLLESTNGPVLASHSNAFTVCNHPRNLTDDQIRALAAKGGLIGLNFVPRFVGPGNLLSGLVNHAEHIAGLVGISHLALGPDFIDHIQHIGVFEPKTQRLLRPEEPHWPQELPSVRVLPLLYQELRLRGFSDDDSRSIMGTNALNFLSSHLPKE